MSRFDYVKLDDDSTQLLSDLRNLCVDLEALLMSGTTHSREYALAMTNLEQAFMWMGKAVRNDYLARQVQAVDPKDIL